MNNIESFESIVEKVEQCKLALQLQEPFFSPFLGKMKHEVVEDGKETFTCGTDGKRIIYNTNFVSKLTGKELVFVIGHEILHCLFLHLSRKEERNALLWNVACDYVVNYELVESQIGSMPSSALYEDKYKNLSAEEIYELLVKECPKSSSGEPLDGQGKPLETLDDHSLAEGLSEKELEELEKEVLESFAEGAKFGGNFASKISRHVKEESKSQVSWEDILRANMPCPLKADYTYRRLNRKTSQYGIYLPSLSVETTLDIAVALDSSGSISEKDLQQFLEEVKEICRQFQSLKLHLFSFDTQVHNYQIFTEDSLEELEKYQVFGGGGTDFPAVWDFMKEINIVPERLLLFTDMMPGGGWGDKDYCETLFIAVTQRTAPFGETIHINTK